MLEFHSSIRSIVHEFLPVGNCSLRLNYSHPKMIYVAFHAKCCILDLWLHPPNFYFFSLQSKVSPNCFVVDIVCPRGTEHGTKFSTLENERRLSSRSVGQTLDCWKRAMDRPAKKNRSKSNIYYWTKPWHWAISNSVPQCLRQPRKPNNNRITLGRSSY